MTHARAQIRQAVVAMLSSIMVYREEMGGEVAAVVLDGQAYPVQSIMAIPYILVTTRLEAGSNEAGKMGAKGRVLQLEITGILSDSDNDDRADELALAIEQRIVAGTSAQGGASPLSQLFDIQLEQTAITTDIRTESAVRQAQTRSFIARPSGTTAAA